MKDFVFVTGNKAKVLWLERFLEQEVDSHRLHLEELQSFDNSVIVEHKAKQAYQEINTPVLVEDTSLVFHAFGQLPGPYVKWFMQEVGLDGMCRMLDNFDDRTATGCVTYGYYDGQSLQVIENKVAGKIASEPKGEGGHGWDPIFIPNGSRKTYAQMNDKELDQFALRSGAIPGLKAILLK